MRRIALLTTPALVSLMLLGGCKAKEEAPAEAAADAPAESTGPNVSGAVAPGVAFTFQYSFTLPAKAVASVQEKHVAACAQLGTSRCRVTGMAYEQPGKDSVQAHTDFLLAPDVAYRFGNDGVAAVEAAEGKLDRASVNGRDAGGEIKLSQQSSEGVQAEIARIEARLKAKGLTAAERTELQQQLGSLNEQLRGQVQERRSNEAAIASTPVSFAYSSEGLVGGSNTFGKAASASASSLGAFLSLLALFAGVTLPWVGAIALVVLGWRFLKAKRGVGQAATE